MILEDLGRLEAVTVGFREAFHPLHHLGGTEMINEHERPTGEGREAETEDRTDVTVTGRSEDAILKTERGFVDELQGESVFDLGPRLCH